MRAIGYAEDAAADAKGERYGKWVRLAAKRFLRDLKRAARPRPPFLWSPERANHACRFIERLPHVEGVWRSSTIELEDFQCFALCQLFGFRNLEGGRRFTDFLFCVARKNAKSTLAAAIQLYVYCSEPEAGPQLISAATTGDQARIVWKVAKSMVEKSPHLREAFGLEAFANTIVRYPTAGTYRAINAKASTQDGLNPSCVELDEIHAHKTHDLLNVLTSAAGARSNPLFLFTTTEGYETPGPWPELRAFAHSILERVVEAEHFLAIIYAVDDRDKDFDERAWLKANPLLPANPALSTALRKAAIEARNMPGKLAEFQIKRLNRRASGAKGWIRLGKWRACAERITPESLEGARCVGAAFDLSSTTDLTAWRLLFLIEGRYVTWGRFWVPEDAVAQRTERKSVSYAGWISEGWMTQTRGDAVDYDLIQAEIEADILRFQPEKIGYDPWNAAQIASHLADNGHPVEQFIQGAKSYHPAMAAFEVAYINGQFRHEGSPVLTWNAANLVPRLDVNLNMAPDKKRSADKIDGMAALLMAFGVAIRNDDAAGFEEFLKNPVRA